MISLFSINKNINLFSLNHAGKVASANIITSLVCGLLIYNFMGGKGSFIPKDLKAGFSVGALSLLCALDAVHYAFLFCKKNQLNLSSEVREENIETIDKSSSSSTNALTQASINRSSQLLRQDSNQSELDQLCNNPYDFFALVAEMRKNTTPFPYDVSFIFLNLCPCKKLTQALRVSLENSAISRLTLADREKEFTLVSVGTGGAYQELVYIAKLAKAGFKKMQIVLIDKQQVFLGSLATFCSNQLSEFTINFSKFDSVESYVENAEKSSNLLPHLLLLLDLSDKKYYTENLSFTEYSFSLLQKNNLLRINTLIAYSHLEFNQGLHTATPVATCCAFDGTSDNLENIQDQNKQCFLGETIQLV